MNSVKLSICIPSIPNRMRMYLQPLYSKLLTQIGDAKDVEVISLMDNKMMSIGRKKSLLLSMATGRYVCIIDDDDTVADDYISTLREKITDDLDVDVICYNQEATIQGKTWLVKTSLTHNQVHPFDQLAVDQNGNTIPCKRPPWQWCLWKREIAQAVAFGDSNWAEDAAFTLDACKKAKTELVIDKVMCYYSWSPTVTETQRPQNPVSVENMERVRINNG
jgi:hypothetical protein